MKWWDRSWNPIVGCTPCSPACEHCYAERLHTQRHKAKLAGAPMPLCYAEPFGKVRFLSERLAQPLHWRKPQRVFVGNMADIFHPDVTDDQLDAIFVHMALCKRHTFMLLTKRPQRMRAYIAGTIARGMTWREGLTGRPLPNVWLGATVWNQPSANERIPILLNTPAAKRFVSVEPMLGPVDMTCLPSGSNDDYDALRGIFRQSAHWDPRYQGVDMDVRLDWVICGGETGPGARPMHPDWPRRLRDQCQDAAVPFFFKQWGEWGTGCEDGVHAHVNLTMSGADWDSLPVDDALLRQAQQAKSMLRLGARRTGRELDGRTLEEVPHA